VRIRLVSIAVLFVVVLAACGGDDKESSSSSTSAPTTSTTTKAAGSADQARAQKLVFVQSDFPPGWTATPPEPRTPEEKADRQELATCSATPGETSTSATATGDTFATGPTTQVLSEASVAKDDAAYQQGVAALNSPKLLPCLQAFLTKGLAREIGSTPTSVEIASISAPKFGDATVANRLKAAATVQNIPLTIFVDVVIMAKSRAQSTGTFINVGQPFDSALETSLINKMGERLNAS
jgi:hypothetical protein